MHNLPLLLGHRGSRTRGCRENTIPAFETAVKHGCDGFEFDVRLTSDDHAIVCHGASSRGRRLAKSAAARLPNLPLLRDVVARFARRAFLNIELKVTGLEQHILSVLNEFPPECGYVVSSFLSDVLLEMRARSEAVPLGLIFQKKIPRWQEVLVDYIVPHYSLVTPKLVQQVHDAGKHIIAWTVNDKRSMLRLAEWGVDGIISDKTDLLVRTLRAQNPADSPVKDPIA